MTKQTKFRVIFYYINTSLLYLHKPNNIHITSNFRNNIYVPSRQRNTQVLKSNIQFALTQSSTIYYMCFERQKPFITQVGLELSQSPVLVQYRSKSPVKVQPASQENTAVASNRVPSDKSTLPCVGDFKFPQSVKIMSQLERRNY